jgi:hypothetical protein
VFVACLHRDATAGWSFPEREVVTRGESEAL